MDSTWWRRQWWRSFNPNRFWTDGLVRFVHVVGCVVDGSSCTCDEANAERCDPYNALPGDWSEEGWFTPAVFARRPVPALWRNGR